MRCGCGDVDEGPRRVVDWDIVKAVQIVWECGIDGNEADIEDVDICESCYLDQDAEG